MKREARVRRAVGGVVLGALLVGFACGDDPARVVVMGTVDDIFSGQPVEGVRFCRLRAPEEACAFSDALGRIAMSVPAESDEWILVDHEVFVPLLMGVRTGTEDYAPPGVLGLVPADLLDVVAAQAGVTVEAGQGLLTLYVYAVAGEEGRGGASLTVEPDPGGTLGYLDDQGDMSLDATATGGPGVGSWVNMAPGDYVATVSHPDFTCRPILAIPASDPETFQLKLLPDRFTYLIVVCD